MLAPLLRRQTLSHVFVVLLVALAAVAIRLSLNEANLDRAVFVTFYPAVILSALYGGLYAGLLATGLGAAFALLIIYPAEQIHVLEPSDHIRMAVFLLSGVVISCLAERRRRAVRKAGQAFKESEARYRLFFEASQDAVLLTSPDGSVHAANPAAQRMFGMAEEEICLAGRKGLVNENDPRLPALLDERSRTGKCTGALEFRRKDGTIFEGEASSGLYIGAEGKLMSAMIIRDVTARKQVEEALRGSEERLKLALDSGQLGMWEWDVRSDRAVWNDKEYELLGLPVGGGREAPETFFDRVHPDDLPAFKRSLAVVMEKGGYWRDECRIIRPDGEARWLAAVARLLRDPDGRPLRMIGVNYDVTERKRLEEELRRAKEEAERRAAELEAIMEQAPIAIWIAHDPECHVITGNLKAYEFARVPLTDNLSPTAPDGNRIPHERFFKDGVELSPFDLPLQRTARTGEVIKDSEIEVRFDDGFVQYVLGNTAPLKDSQGRVTGAIAAFSDLTGRKRMERELLDAKAEADRANQAKSEFLANMSHEIRTPMNGIIGMTDLALTEDVSPRAREYLQFVSQSGNALLEIINDILDLSKIESGTVALEKKPFRLREGLESMLKALSVSAEAKGLDFRHAMDPDVPDCLVGDQGRLRQVLTNLIGNAVKFTEKGAVRVSVTLDEEPASPGLARLLFKVKDDGVGIPRERLREAFEAFSQVGLSSHAKYGGTGLGLSISKSLVEMMGGRIWAESELGKGSVFSFVAEFGLAEEKAKPAPRPEAPRISQETRRMKILLAEDNSVNRILATSLLKKRGHSVMAVGNGEEALAALGKERFDAIFMDVRMPDMDGEEATRRIRSGEAPGVDPGIPIIALTAYALKGDRERFLAAGMDDYIAKPLGGAELDKALEAAASRLAKGTPPF